MLSDRKRPWCKAYVQEILGCETQGTVGHEGGLVFILFASRQETRARSRANVSQCEGKNF